MSNRRIDSIDLTQLFKELFADFGSLSLNQPKWDGVTEHSDHYVAVIEMPGVKKENLDLTITHDSPEGVELTIKAIKGIRTFTRNIVIGGGQHPVDSAAITSKLEDGILTITAPKRVPPKVEPRKVKVL